MHVVMFYHSLISDWNHGNAHFLRGIATELISRGVAVSIYEPRAAWSVQNLIASYGPGPILRFMKVFPHLRSRRYTLDTLNLDAVLDGADIVLVHEWNEHDLVRRIGEHHASHGGYRLFFHDAHHRSVTDPRSMAAYDLQHYDGVLAFGNAVRDVYLANGWARRAWTWHEAADTRVFHPVANAGQECDLVWIGNWGDEERSDDLHEFLIRPVHDLGLGARAYGVGYPDQALAALERAGIEFCGWLPNYRVPDAFARGRVTIHVPRRPYTKALPGIPTIRPFEALACGIPLVSSPWDDVEGLFEAGKDYLVANDGNEMMECLDEVLRDHDLAHDLSENGLRTILGRHTCGHRVDELLAICRMIDIADDSQQRAAVVEKGLVNA